MDSSTCSVGNQTFSQTSAQRKFYQWILKWINGEHAHSEMNGDELRDIRHLTKPDVPTFATLLQAIGFKLLSFEKQNEPLILKRNESDIENKTEKGVVRIAIECDNSRMRAVLELEGTACQCPNPDHLKDACFWSVSGTGPVGSTDNIVHKIEETGSNLLPRLSKDVSRLLHDVSYKLFDTIASEPDINRNTDVSLNISCTSSLPCEPKAATQDNTKKDVGIARSYTQPEIRRRTNSISSKCTIKKQQRTTNSDANLNRAPTPVNQNKPILQRQRTWDIDIENGSLDGEPRSSPPKLTSSPAVVAELSQSLGQISLQSETENPRNVTQYILGAQQNLEKALKMLLFKKPSISSELSPNQDYNGTSENRATTPVNQNKPILQRQRTWDIDIENGNSGGESRPSTPRITSSPAVIVELSQSLGQISLQSEIENPRNITEYIQGAQQNLEKALKMLLFDKPLVSNELSPHQDYDSASVKSAPANTSPAGSVDLYKTTRSNTISNIKPSSKMSYLPRKQQSQLKTNLSQTPKARRSLETTLSKSLTRRSMQLEQENPKPTLRRNSFYLPSSASPGLSLLSKPLSTDQKFFGSRKYSVSKPNLTVDFDYSNRDFSSRKKATSTNQQIGTSKNFETRNTTNNRPSLLKPPTKVSKSIPIKVKPVQPPKIDTSIVKKPKG